ncbi:MAG: glycoside hydrolase family 43 protein [Lachnospiraceae bacterium]
MRKNVVTAFVIIGMAAALTACGSKETEQSGQLTPTTEPVTVTAAPEQPTQEPAMEPTTEPVQPEEEIKVTDEELFRSLKRTVCYKGINYANPLITQEFGADPFAMVYGDTLYVYMTQDAFEKNADGVIGENTYGKIKSIRVISTKDMVNWTDHGDIHVAGTTGSAKWARNSWAPAAAWKNIDGKDRFFLYFADSGNGIGVLQADSPTGPFQDPIGTGLITRSTPNCADVLWLFDPAVFVDDDGRAYLYFGGGVPQNQASHPMTGRVVELGDDMISIKGEPQTIDAPYLFEDSGIHKFGNKYYYTYCSNWQVDKEGTATYGFHNAEIVSMESDSPMGPFVIKETILANPGNTFGLYGNNHHCVFSFQGNWYITYHTRVLEQKMGVEKGYRCTFINSFTMQEDGTIGKIKQNLQGCEQLIYVNPYETVNACTFSHQGGLEVTGSDSVSKYYGAGDMALASIDSGDFLKLTGVDFSDRELSAVTLHVRKTAELSEDCVIELRLDNYTGEVLGYVHVAELMEGVEVSVDFTEITAEIKKKVEGVHNLYMTFSGSGYEILDWKFIGEESH